MNLYLRYFDDETLVTSVDAALDFLRSIDDIDVDPALEADIREYAASNVLYPKRYKIRSRVYFIIIKTVAATMQEFKEHRNQKKDSAPTMEPKQRPVSAEILKLNEERQGWYEGRMLFKRVNFDPTKGKYRYLDTPFVAQVKASSGMDCYNRIVSHLQERVDPRSQFPSPKGKNYSFRYLGAAKQL